MAPMPGIGEDERRMTTSTRLRAPVIGLLLAMTSGACVFGPVETPTPAATVVASPSVVATPSPLPSPTPESSPSPTPAPPLSLDLPSETDFREITASVSPEVTADGGRILVTVTNLADTRITEIVLRWPTELGQTLALAPFVATQDRIRDGGPPLVQPWSKWVEGPGSLGEPAGTISLGWGPMDPGMRLEIPIAVRRIAPGPVGFDLQLLTGEALLTLDDGRPAEIRVEVP